MDPSIRPELLRLETALANRNPHATGDAGGDLATLIADDFVELGASGAIWDAAAARRTVTTVPPGDVELEAFDTAELAPGVVLVTYRVTGDRPANRSSIWVRRGDRWQIRFHQGTLLPR